MNNLHTNFTKDSPAYQGNGPRVECNPEGEDDLYGTEVLANPQRLIDNINYINDWGIERTLIRECGATALSQIKKLKEEVQELEDALIIGDEVEIVDGIGDSLVVLVQIARLAQVTLDEASDRAYSQIRYRKGQMVDGVFIKQEDLDAMEQDYITRELYD